MSESIVETLTTIGLVAGFPLLLLCFMLSLEKLESWGLRERQASERPPPDLVEAAVEEVSQMAASQSLSSTEPDDDRWPVTAQHAGRTAGRAT